jgi:hypothetical protein
MSPPRRRRCAVCHHGFDPDPRVGDRQKVCRGKECQKARRERTQAEWRGRHPGYFVEWRAKKKVAKARLEPIDPARTPPPLSRLPWELAQEEFGVAGADFIASLGRVLVKYAKDERRDEVVGIPEESLQVAEGVAKDQRRPQPAESTRESQQVEKGVAKDEKPPVPA